MYSIPGIQGLEALAGRLAGRIIVQGAETSRVRGFLEEMEVHGNKAEVRNPLTPVQIDGCPLDRMPEAPKVPFHRLARVMHARLIIQSGERKSDCAWFESTFADE